MKTQKQRAESFKALHEREGAFVIPNPWDAGSARLLAGLGFEALATTSAGFANSLGRPDGRTARAENLLRGRQDLDDTVRRLQAFEAAGADVLYAPGLTTLDEVRLVAGALSKPVNVLGPLLKGVTVAQLADAGAKRISVGGAL